MARYVSRREAGLGYWDDDPLIPDLTVDGPRGPTFSGLLDADGKPLFRLPNPIGFGRDQEWS